MSASARIKSEDRATQEPGQGKLNTKKTKYKRGFGATRDWRVNCKESSEEDKNSRYKPLPLRLRKNTQKKETI